MNLTQGKRPRTTRKLMVTFRNGWIVGPYKVAQLVWDDRGWESDVVAAEFAK